MQWKATIATAMVTIIGLASCTAVDVSQVDRAHNLTHVCIEENPKVIVVDFVSTLEEAFEQHLITTELYRGVKPSHCEFNLTYTALRSWDITPYLSHAELRLYRGAQRVGYADYHLRGKGGLSLMKWASVESKMMPVVEKLLAQYQ
jgi:hypothetical protein